MLHLRLGYDSFGGRQTVVNFLAEKGLLNKTCPFCHEEGTVLNETGRGIPRFYCPCRKMKFSCAVGTAFNWKQVRNIPLFIFVALCFCLRVNVKSIQALSGADYRTVKRYITVLREALSACAKKEHREGRLKLGGEGKVVEVDEMFVCHRKYHRGRRHAKEGVWVLGLTEVKAASHPIEDPLLLKKLKKDEDRREKAAQERLRRRKRQLPTQREQQEPTLPSPFGPSGTMVTAPAMPLELQLPDHLDDDEQDQDDNDPVHLVHVDEGDDEDTDQALSDVAYEKQMSKLFSQSRKNEEKKTIFFVLPDRSKATLEKFIRENVLPGSTIYTDEWRGYNGLKRLGFKHKTICHKKRYSRFEFKQNLAIRVTTNHIERMWVELRRSLKYMGLKSFSRYVWLETYRQLKLYHLRYEMNFEKVLEDFAKFGTPAHANWFEA